MEGLSQKEVFGNSAEVPSMCTSPAVIQLKQPFQWYASSTLRLHHSYVPIRYATFCLTASSAVSSQGKTLATTTHLHKCGLHA